MIRLILQSLTYIYIYKYVCVLSWKQCALPVITTMALWQLMHLRTWYMVTIDGTCILRSSCYCEIWVLCVSWITYDHLSYAPCLACWTMCPPGYHRNGFVATFTLLRSCAQVHELTQSHCGDNREGTLFSWLHIYYAHLVSVRFEHSVCRGSLMTTYIYI